LDVDHEEFAEFVWALPEIVSSPLTSPKHFLKSTCARSLTEPRIRFHYAYIVTACPLNGVKSQMGRIIIIMLFTQGAHITKVLFREALPTQF